MNTIIGFSYFRFFCIGNIRDYMSLPRSIAVSSSSACIVFLSSIPKHRTNKFDMCCPQYKAFPSPQTERNGRIAPTPRRRNVSRPRSPFCGTARHPCSGVVLSEQRSSPF